MRSQSVSTKTLELQDNLYVKLNSVSRVNKNWGRLYSVPVALLDVALDTFKAPLAAIEYVGLAGINLFEAACSKEYTLKDALVCTQIALEATVSFPIALIVAPFKVIFQVFAIIINPKKVQSISWHRPTFSL